LFVEKLSVKKAFERKLSRVLNADTTKGWRGLVAVQKAIWVTENDSKLIWDSDAEKEQW